MEREEAERRELHKMMMEDDKDKDKKGTKAEEDPMANVVCMTSESKNKKNQL